ncbi:uncharacterized protein DEA37_0013348, partial [Paragonimus westermani]
LSVQWNAKTDSFILTFIHPDKPVTRKGILSRLSTLYGSLAFVSPCSLPGKHPLQALCQELMGWDKLVNLNSAVRRWTLVDASISYCLFSTKEQ